MNQLLPEQQVAAGIYCCEHLAADYLLNARIFFEEAAKSGNVIARTKLATFYLHGHGGYLKHEINARKYCEHAARQDYSEALSMLGYFYEHGLGGVRIDSDTAIDYYSLAVAQGNLIAKELYMRILYDSVSLNDCEDEEETVEDSEPENESVSASLSSSSSSFFRFTNPVKREILDADQITQAVKILRGNNNALSNCGYLAADLLSISHQVSCQHILRALNLLLQ